MSNDPVPFAAFQVPQVNYAEGSRSRLFEEIDLRFHDVQLLKLILIKYCRRFRIDNTKMRDYLVLCNT